MTMTSKSIEKSINELEIKAEKDGDIRRFQSDGSVASLLSKLRDMYKLGADFQIKFKDDEGDLVTIADDNDLATAVRICGPKLRIVVKASETRPEALADVHVALGELSSDDEDEDVEDEEPSVQPDNEASNPDMPFVDAIHAHRGGWHRGRGRGHRGHHRGHRGHHRGHHHHDHHHDRHHGPHGHHEHHEHKHHDHPDDVNEHHHKGRGRGRGGRGRFCADGEEPHFPRQRQMLARIVKHVTLPDGAKVDPGAALKKTWRLRNDSQVAWPENCEIICVGGDMILGNTMPGVVRVRGGVLAGQETDVSVDLVAPAEPGLYQAYFRLKEVDGRKFGQRIWLSINVTAGTSESDEFVEVPAHGRDDGTVTSPNESNDYEMAIEKLREMGFTDDSVPRLVQRYRGNVERVAHRLIRKAK